MLATVPPLTEVYARLDARARVLLGTGDASKAVTAALLWRHRRTPTLVLVARESDAEATFEQLAAWCGDAALHFPARGAQLSVNGEAATAKPFAQDRSGKASSSCVLAWSETWVGPG